MSNPSQTPKKEIRALLRLSGPVVATQLANLALNTTDVLMAGRLGARDLAAIAIGNGLSSPVVYTLMGVLLAVTPIVAQLHGAGKGDEIGARVRQGVWAALILGIPGAVSLHFLSPIMTLLGIDADIVPLTTGYLSALSWGIPFLMLYFVLRFFNDGIALTKPALFVSILAIPVNALANYAFMYGHWGFPQMGAVGTGYATALVWVIMLLSLLAWIIWRPEYKIYRLWRFCKPDMTQLREIFGIGLPSGANVFLELGLFSMITLMIGSLGNTSVGAHQIALNIASLAFMVPLGISIAISSRVGQAMGRGSLPDARLAGMVGIGLCACFGVVMSTMMILMRSGLVSLYTTEADIHALAASLLFLAALFQLSDGVQVSCVGSLRGLKDTRIPMVFNLIAYWGVGFPLGWWLGMNAEMGARGFWIGLSGGLTASALLNFLRFNHLSKSNTVDVLE